MNDPDDSTQSFVRFTNDIVLGLHEERGADREAIFREQIRYTLEEHFRKQRKLQSLGLKILSLFFIDKVDNYAKADGLIRRLFVDAFQELKDNFPEWKDRKVEEVHKGYFAEKKRRGGITEKVDSSTGRSEEDRAAYNLIMRDKERLLSFSEPTAFIFSHSALREGWDNPNVFQICTLNQTTSEVKKRQEVGRGMRLAVNQIGQRLFDEKINVLTVVANESYESFVAEYQREMVEAFGEMGAAPKPVNVRKKQQARLRPEMEFPPAFKDLWERIKHKTRYTVQVDSEKLINDVVKKLDATKIDPPRLEVSKAKVQLGVKDVFQALHVAKQTVANLAGRHEVPNLVAMMADLLEHINPPVRLTRRTLLEIIKRLKSRKSAFDNPQDFVTKAVNVIRTQAADQLVAGIQYEKINEWYELSQFDPAIETSSENLIEVARSIYDFIVFQSKPEKKFIEDLEAMEAVKVFLKLPSWFKVPTPIGSYNPDWAIALEDRDAHGEPTGETLYMVRETKSSVDADDLRRDEERKIKCGERHFKGALGVDFDVAKDASEIGRSGKTGQS